jgi:hypothetical protein
MCCKRPCRKPRARIEVLLSLLGSQQRVMLAADAVEAVP